MRTRAGWWGIAWALAGLVLASDAGATAPAFPGVTTVTLPSPEQHLPIPDNGSLVTLIASDLAGVVVDVDVTVDIRHPTSDQLDVYLVAPSGRTVTLTTDNGGQNDNVFAGATFDDQAPGAPNVRNFAYADLVATGPIQPEGGLSALMGEAAAGPWALVVVDDTGGSTGTLESWSLTISTVSSLPQAAPVADFDGPGAAIPDNTPAGAASTIDVSGLGARLLAVTATVSITHANAAHLDLFLTSPAGTKIDLATDVGNGLANLYHPATFDDAATPIGDGTLPPSGTSLGTVAPEGSLGAFAGEDPNGTWTLTVVDDTGGTIGSLDGWQLHLVTAAACGDGVVGPGEQCDDGNATDGDGCDHDCTPSACGNGIVGGDEQCDDGNTQDGDGCSSTCRLAETNCDDCVDDDGNGLVDAADPGCSEAAMQLARSSAVPAKGALILRGDVPLPDGPGGPVTFVLGDGNGTILCAALGDATPRGRKLVASGPVGGGTVTVSVGGGRVVVKAKHVDLGALDDPTVHVGVGIGGHRFAGAAAFRTRGAKRVYP